MVVIDHLVLLSTSKINLHPVTYDLCETNPTDKLDGMVLEPVDDSHYKEQLHSTVKDQERQYEVMHCLQTEQAAEMGKGGMAPLPGVSRNQQLAGIVHILLAYLNHCLMLNLPSLSSQ